MINILPWPVYRRGKGPRYPFSGKPVGSQKRSGIYGEEKDFLSLAGIDPIPSSSDSLSIVSINIGQSWLRESIQYIS